VGCSRQADGGPFHSVSKNESWPEQPETEGIVQSMDHINSGETELERKLETGAVNDLSS
jgi:hypothetical protein